MLVVVEARKVRLPLTNVSHVAFNDCSSPSGLSLNCVTGKMGAMLGGCPFLSLSVLHEPPLTFRLQLLAL